MKLTLLAVGRLKEAWLEEGAAEFAKRVRGKLPLEIIEPKDETALLKAVPPRAELWALDERGTQVTSEELSRMISDRMDRGEQGIAFAIGGADGHSPELIKRARFKWSLGKLTLPHRLARVIVLEQIYRALSIRAGEPYHRP